MSKEEKVKGGRLANLKVYILTFSKWLGIAVLRKGGIEHLDIVLSHVTHYPVVEYVA